MFMIVVLDAPGVDGWRLRIRSGPLAPIGAARGIVISRWVATDAEKLSRRPAITLTLEATLLPSAAPYTKV